MHLTPCEGMRRLRAERRAWGLCIYCGKAADDGRTTCADCRQAARDKWKKKRKTDKRRLYASARACYKKRRAERIAAGVCIRCGVRKPSEWRKTCNACLRKRYEVKR